MAKETPEEIARRVKTEQYQISPRARLINVELSIATAAYKAGQIEEAQRSLGVAVSRHQLGHLIIDVVNELRVRVSSLRAEDDKED